MDKLATYLAAERERLKGGHEKALALYRQVAAADPDDWKITECIAGELMALGQKGEAVRELFQAAHKLIWRTSYLEARALLERILRLDPAQELFVTRGVRGRLEEIDRHLQAAPAPAAEPAGGFEREAGFEETRSALEALVGDETSGGFRVPDDILAVIDRVPVVRKAARRLVLHVQGDTLAMDGRELLVGRGEGSNLVLRHPDVREAHARIVEIEGHHLLLSDDPEAETFRNGERVDGAELMDGDVLAFGRGGPEARVAIAHTLP